MKKGLFDGFYGFFIKAGTSRFNRFHDDGMTALVDRHPQHHDAFLAQLPGQSRVFGETPMSEPGTVGSAEFRIDRPPAMPSMAFFSMGASGSANPTVSRIPQSLSRSGSTGCGCVTRR